MKAAAIRAAFYMYGENMISIDQLRRLVSVNYETGSIIWNEREEGDFLGTGKGGAKTALKRFNSTFAGREALNHHDNHGYLKGRILRTELKAHRVVWAHFHGVWPDGVIDHINRIKDDNRISNLRDVHSWQNGLNREGTLDLPFIYCSERPFFGSRTISGVTYSIEPQKTKEDAVSAWIEVEDREIPEEHWVYKSGMMKY